jgi:hypothetical protein
MDYEVRCECRKTLGVSAADAGSSVRCACGRNVDVPPLHMLRTAAGEQGVSPAVQLQGMLLKNELPGTQRCACCHRDTDHLIRVSVVCEEVIVKEPSSKGAAVVGCMAFGLVGGLIAMFLSKLGQTPIQHGTQVSFIVPVRICEVCDHELTNSGAIRAALRNTQAYAELLEEYPDAAIRRLEAPA